MTPSIFRVVDNEADLLAAYAVRTLVFIGEQNCPFTEEFDGLDAGAIHIVGFESGEPAAAARIRDVDGWAKLERIALLPRVRGRGLGHECVEFMLEVARQNGFHRYKMHAQTHLEAFYAQHGFRRDSERFVEAGIDHYRMIRVDPPDAAGPVTGLPNSGS